MLYEINKLPLACHPGANGIKTLHEINNLSLACHPGANVVNDGIYKKREL